MIILKQSVIVLIKATKEDSPKTAILYYEFYFWQSYKKKLNRDIIKEVYKGYNIQEIKVI